MTPPDESVSFEGATLPAVGLVAELSDEDRAMLSSYGQFGFLEAGHLAIRQGTPQDRLYFVISGVFHAKREDEGRETFLGTISQGEWFGEINIFDPSAASATVSAVGATQLWSISREELLAYLGTYSEAGLQLMIGIATNLSRRMRNVSKKLAMHSEYEDLATRIH
ncbi:MAG: cyclic nucleotide-binding domain-containing protein [Chthoniobacterales bacterium]